MDMYPPSYDWPGRNFELNTEILPTNDKMPNIYSIYIYRQTGETKIGPVLEIFNLELITALGTTKKNTTTTISG